MARTISAELLAAQQATKRKPYIRVVINSIDYSDRVLFVEHHEEPYRDYASIVLSNADRGLDSVGAKENNLLGFRFKIGYGYYTGQTVAEPNGDGAGNEFSYSADLWVKSQQMVSSPGQLVCVLYCEGQWGYLREQRVMALADNVGVVDPDEIEDPQVIITIEDKTVYELIESTLEDAFSWTLNAAPSPDDDILTSFKPVFSFGGYPYAAAVLTDLAGMTKCYLRPKADLTWEIVYPQSSDSADETFYSYTAPYFLEYAEALSLVIPNKIVVFAGNPDDLPEWPTPVIVGEAVGDTGNYVEVLEPQLAPTITNQDDAAKRAAALLTKYTNAGVLTGYAIVHHDARVELYDYVKIVDTRGY